MSRRRCFFSAALFAFAAVFFAGRLVVGVDSGVLEIIARGDRTVTQTSAPGAFAFWIAAYVVMISFLSLIAFIFAREFIRKR